MKLEKSCWWVACVAVLVFYLLASPRMWQCEGVDEIEYLGLASSLAGGHGYAINGESHVLYPPLYPLILSLSMRGGALPWQGMYQSNALFGFGAFMVAATWIRRCGRPGIVASWLALFSYYAWSFSTRYLLSEPFALLMSAGLLVLAWDVLDRNRAPLPEALVIALIALACAMARFGSVALFAAVALAGWVRWRQTKAPAGLLVCVLVLLAGAGFTIFWETRAAVLAPNAAESYGRWALRLVGLSHETAGIIARNAGEGTTGTMSWPARILETGVRCGQYVLSVVRMPGNFAPLGLFAAVLTLTGLAAHLRRTPWSPVGWYVLASLGMISLTSWISSYLRYLYLVAPFMFFFFVAGADVWRRRLGEGDNVVGSVMTLWGLGGLWWTLAHRPGFAQANAEQAYVVGIGMFCALAYLVMALSGAATFLRKAALDRPAPVAAVVVAILLVGLHNTAIAAMRFKETLNNSMLKGRHLVGAVEAGRWIGLHTPPDAAVITSMPKLMSFLSNRRCVLPAEKAAATAPYAVAVGGLLDVPAFRADAEAQLLDLLRDGERKGAWQPRYAADESTVFFASQQDAGHR